MWQDGNDTVGVKMGVAVLHPASSWSSWMDVFPLPADAARRRKKLQGAIRSKKKVFKSK